ncbi:MAG: hypothetical protein NTZ33_14475 [Bacteroidetes bacterium]|nr:hypothetical protein [Bacteroidota bacterium]
MIFNKSDNGKTEVKELLGFISKAVNFENLKTYVTSAENAIRKIISKEVFKLAEDHYLSEDYNTHSLDDILEVSEENPEPEEANAEIMAFLQLDILVSRIQLCVAFMAYKQFVPSNDLSHGANGRLVTKGEDQSTAWSWQIEKDNQNLNDLYHTFLSDLLDFLDDCCSNDDAEDISSAWISTDAYKLVKKCFIQSASEFDPYYNIESSSFMFHKITAGMHRIQLRKFKPALRAELYDKIAEYILDGKDPDDLTAAELNIYELCKMPLALYTMADSIMLFNAQILPDRIVQNFVANREGENQKNLPVAERSGAAKFLNNEADACMREVFMEVRKYWAEKEGVVLVDVPLVNIDPDEKFVRL